MFARHRSTSSITSCSIGSAVEAGIHPLVCVKRRSEKSKTQTHTAQRERATTLQLAQHGVLAWCASMVACECGADEQSEAIPSRDIIKSLPNKKTSDGNITQGSSKKFCEIVFPFNRHLKDGNKFQSLPLCTLPLKCFLAVFHNKNLDYSQTKNTVVNNTIFHCIRRTRAAKC